MELDRIYLYVIVVLLLAFLGLGAVYAMYLVQQKVSSIALTSADVAFFPVRAAAFAVRCFFRATALCFDLTLFGLRSFLQTVKLFLTCLETVLLVWRIPVVLMISVLHQVRRLRKPGTKRPSEDQPTAVSGQNDRSASGPADEDLATGVFRRMLRKIRKVKKLLRPDLLAIQSVVDAKNYLRLRAGLEKAAN